MPYDGSVNPHTSIILAQAWLDTLRQHHTIFHTWMGCGNDFVNLKNIVEFDLKEDKRTHKELASAYPVWSHILLGQTPITHTFNSNDNLDFGKMFVSLRPVSLRSFVLWRCGTNGIQEAASAVRSNSSILFSAIREDVCTLLSQVWQDISQNKWHKKNFACNLVSLRTFPTPELILQLNSKISSPSKNKIVAEVEKLEEIKSLINDCCKTGIGERWEYAFNQTYFVTKIVNGCVFRRTTDKLWECCVDPYLLSYKDMQSVIRLLKEMNS